jgi:hypothetical protein
MDTTEKKSKNAIEAYLDRDIERHVLAYQSTYAKNPDGSVNQALADRISWEVNRRGEMGKQLDVYEPMRWVAIRSVLGTGGAIASKIISDRLTGNNKMISTSVMAGIGVSTAIANAIDLVRVVPRYNAGLRGGADTAVKMYQQDIPYDTPASPSYAVRSVTHDGAAAIEAQQQRS